MQICDSSSDEDEAPAAKDDKMECDADETVVKKEKENKTPSPEKIDSNKSAANGGRKRRAKVKKMVTRTYEDEDGFISKCQCPLFVSECFFNFLYLHSDTVHETEEVSCSEEEPEVIEPPPKKITPAPAATAASKKKISPPAGKKQGSILSFFGKK